MPQDYNPFQPTLTDVGLKCCGLELLATPPSKVLQGVVHSYLQVSATRPTPYPVIPDGTQAVFISPHGLKISGALTQAYDVQMLGPGEYFGIRFFPGALRHFFELNLGEITNQFVDSQYLSKQGLGRLHERLYQYDEFPQRAALCEYWLLQCFDPRSVSRFDQALSLIYSSLGNIKVSQLASAIGWSSRHLNRLFQQHTGLSTKSFAQTIRIQSLCKQLYGTQGGLRNTLPELGYFDQSHLIKEHKKYLLSNPGRFFDRFMSDFYNH